MSLARPEGRATLVRSYRNMSVREIRARLEGALPDAERVTAQAELLRRGADDGGPDTTFIGTFEPTDGFEAEPASAAPVDDAEREPATTASERRVWPIVLVLVAAGLAGIAAWALHAGLIHG